jgi:hypothetical protein
MDSQASSGTYLKLNPRSKPDKTFTTVQSTKMTPKKTMKI